MDVTPPSCDRCSYHNKDEITTAFKAQPDDVFSQCKAGEIFSIMKLSYNLSYAVDKAIRIVSVLAEAPEPPKKD